MPGAYPAVASVSRARPQEVPGSSRASPGCPPTEATRQPGMSFPRPRYWPYFPALVACAGIAALNLWNGRWEVGGNPISLYGKPAHVVVASYSVVIAAGYLACALTFLRRRTGSILDLVAMVVLLGFVALEVPFGLAWALVTGGHDGHFLCTLGSWPMRAIEKLEFPERESSA
jgi:hypothetical protein